MGVPEIEEFLTHLAVEGNVAAATQNQALNAILFLYRQVLQIELAERVNAIRAKRSQQISIALSSKLNNYLIRSIQVIMVFNLSEWATRLVESIDNVDDDVYLPLAYATTSRSQASSPDRDPRGYNYR